MDEDIHESYDSNAVRDLPSVPACTVPEVGDGNARRGSTPNGLSVQHYLDRTTTISGKNMS